MPLPVLGSVFVEGRADSRHHRPRAAVSATNYGLPVTYTCVPPRLRVLVGVDRGTLPDGYVDRSYRSVGSDSSP